MEKLRPATLAGQVPVRQFIRDSMVSGLTRREAKEQYRRLMKQEVFVNDLYQVNVDQVKFSDFYPKPITHLSIKRRDKEVIHDWRDLQEIKNQLCGPEREGIELYPAESRLVDTTNQYHIWVLPEGVIFPLGYKTRDVTNDCGMPNTKQRPRE